jgi:formylglycine-generating enzyme
VVNGGEFNRDNDSNYPATISSFRLDKYEVTVGRFRNFVKAVVDDDWRPAAGSGKHSHLNGGAGLKINAAAGNEAGWSTAWNTQLSATKATWDDVLMCNSTYETWTPSGGANETKPINCVNWYHAVAFCIGDQGFVPSEAEWNYAAAGGNAQRLYPWSPSTTSTTIDCSYANYKGAEGGVDFCVSPGTGATLAVGSLSPKGNGLFGQVDLSGNVFEWTQDWYVAGYTQPCTDCAYQQTATQRVMRGGGFGFASNRLASSYRSTSDPAGPYEQIGVRCARAP